MIMENNKYIKPHGNNGYFLKMPGCRYWLEKADLEVLFNELRQIFGDKLKLRPMSEEPMEEICWLHIIHLDGNRSHVSKNEHGYSLGINNEYYSWSYIFATSEKCKTKGWCYDHELADYLKENSEVTDE